MFTAQLVCQGVCKQSQIVRVFGVSKKSVSRSVSKYRQQGPRGFFQPKKARGGNVITDEVKNRAQQLFDEGNTRSQVAEQLGIKPDTLRKAINQARISERTRANDCVASANDCVASDKSSRSHEDASCQMGMGCTRALERVSAAIGLVPQGAPTRFEHCRDVSFGGVMCALPALIASGLFTHVDKCFNTLNGYYTSLQVLLVVAYMALCRIKTVEQLQYHSPGELGKLMGLDRVPEVRCLRNKLAQMSENDAPEKWSALLSKDWMHANSELAGALYVDGHVRVYHGEKTKLPRRYVSRQRLCLRGTSDYWVNDVIGQPYFVVNRPVDQGLLEALRTDIVPRLLRDVPSQPSEQQLRNDPYRHRFILLFDREGYSPSFFKQMYEEHRIACISYHKFPKDNWPPSWFVDTEIQMPDGELVSMKLAEMGSFVGDNKNGVWMREMRKLCDSGHQTSLISTAYSQLGVRDAALLFSRWSQENFFAYMEKHYALDLLSEHGTQPFADTQPVINPVHRELERERNALKSKLTHRRASYAAIELHADMKNIAKYQRQKSELLEEIQQLENQLEQLKNKLVQTPKHIDWHELPQPDKFEQLKPSRKRLLDTIKMIAYRAETALVNIVREKLTRKDDARSLIRDLCMSDADILPDLDSGTLTIQVHSMANPRSNRAIEHLLAYLNDAEFHYPGTNLRLVFRIAAPPSNLNPIR